MFQLVLNRNNKVIQSLDDAHISLCHYVDTVEMQIWLSHECMNLV